MTQTESKSATQVDISGRRLAHNTLLNLVGRILPLLVAIFTVPYVIHHLGPDRYGLLSLAYIVVGYFALFNLGIGPATTKFVAELLGKGEIEKLPELVWTALASQACFGLAGGILLAFASPLLVDRVLKIPAELHPQAQTIFLIMAALLPFDFASGSMQGVLGASQRFDLLNAVSIPASTLSYLLPVGALALGFGLPAIVLFLALARLASLAVVIVLCLRLYPELRRVRFDLRRVRSLLGFGGWVAVSGFLIPILTNFEKLAIATLLSVGALAYYVPCYLMMSKVALLPASLATALFPAISYCEGKSGASDALRKLSLNPIKYIVLVMAPVTVAFFLFGGSILRIWLGADFARHSTTLFRVLALAYFIHAFAYVPLTAVNGLGRPELKAKLDLVQTPIYMALCWVLIMKMGLVGAALARLVVTTIDVVCLFAMSKKLVGFSVRDVASSALVKSFAVASIPVVSGLLLVLATIPLSLKLAIFFISLMLYALATWWVALDDQDRLILSGGLQRLAFVGRPYKR